MSKNSIEEDIKKVENYLENNSAINDTNSNFFKNGGWEIVDLEIPKAMQYILADYKRVLKENETLKCSIAVANKLEKRIKEKFISKEKIEEWRKSKDKSLMWSNVDDLYYFNKWTKELLESEE